MATPVTRRRRRTGRASRPDPRILNACSPKYCDWSGIVNIDPKPPVLWTHGTADIVIADGSAWEMEPSARWAQSPAGRERTCFLPSRWSRRFATCSSDTEGRSRVQMEMLEGSGHGPLFDAAERWSELFYTFLVSAEQGAHAAAAKRATD